VLSSARTDMGNSSNMGVDHIGGATEPNDGGSAGADNTGRQQRLAPDRTGHKQEPVTTELMGSASGPIRPEAWLGRC
jgi:hypothetical protein